ncbi:spermidine synthase [Alicyclobacillus sp. ALC3]|uniref:spermidine synthase n=1 Tax=Alicyclobacillus sp. ALC3 TaxID=2796143 RepID=UPI002377E070|nr:spermidine synthase [Alicyclobacillus sp. ALC3]WDL97096.1 spermidine synthase [Alicyclobacillus sp. ALC3]
MFARESTLLTTSGQVHPTIEVIEQNHIRYLRFGHNGGWQGARSLTCPDELIFPYQRAFASLTNSLPTVDRFLSIGVGIGTALRTVLHNHAACDMYGVEIDETVVNVAIEYFDSPSHRDVNYWIGDGVTFLANVELTFDLIFVDAYMRNQIYSACLEPAFATVLYAGLTDNGLAACNIISSTPPTGQVRAFLDAAQDIFAEVLLLPVGVPFAEQNTLAVLSKRAGIAQDWIQQIRSATELSWLQRVSWPNRLSGYSGKRE